MDLGRAFRVPFSDDDWFRKVGLAGLWALLGVTAPALAGAQLRYIRSVASGDERLPDWDGFGELWVKGCIAWIAYAVYLIPAGLVALAALIPTFVLAQENEAAGTATIIVGLLSASVLALLASILYYAGFTAYAMTDSVSSFFSPGEILRRANAGTGYWTAWGYSIVVNIAMSTLSAIASGTGIGGILAPWISASAAYMTAFLLGQWAAVEYATHPGQQTLYAPPPPPAPYAQVPPPPPAPGAPSGPFGAPESSEAPPKVWK